MASRGKLQDRVRHVFQEILESPTGYAKFKRIMAATKKEEAYLAYFKEAADRGYGKAPQYVEIENASEDLTREELEILRASLISHRPQAGDNQVQ